jgi:hypothetical protein
MKRIFTLFLILVIGVVISGCGKSPTAPGDGTSLSEKGDTQLNIGKIPDDFPTDVPIYKNIKSTKAITGGVKLLHMQSDDSKAQILDFYKKELAAEKWQLTAESRNSREEILASKQQRSLTVSIVDKGTAGRVIDITY